jgi:hypothetical protein
MFPMLLAAFLAVAQTATPRVTVLDHSSIAVQIKSTVKANKARIGDEVVAEVTVPVLQDGHIVIPKGARVVGRVIAATAHTKEHPESVLAVRFDNAEWKGGSAALNAYIVRTLAVEQSPRQAIEYDQINCIPMMRLVPQQQSGQTGGPPPQPTHTPQEPCDPRRARVVPSTRPEPGLPTVKDVFVRILTKPAGATELISPKKNVTLPAGVMVELRQVAP